MGEVVGGEKLEKEKIEGGKVDIVDKTNLQAKHRNGDADYGSDGLREKGLSISVFFSEEARKERTQTSGLAF